jgi:polysaccharide biosynthesis transport protein
MEEKQILTDPSNAYRYMQDQDEDRGVDFRSYLLVILNRRWLIVSVMILIVLGVGLYSFLQTPMYMSKAVLEIDVPGSYLFVSDPVTQPLYWRNRESFISTQYTLLRGKNLARSVARRLNLTPADLKSYDPNRSAKTATPQSGQIDEVALQLIQMVQIQPISETTLCEIVFTTPNPHLSMILASTWAQEYLDQHLNSLKGYSEKAEELLTEQVARLQKEISDKERVLYDYSLKQQIVKPDKSQSMAASALTDTNSALLTATRERIAAEVRYHALKSSSREGIPEVLSHPAVQRLQLRYSDLERDYAEKARKYKEDYPEMVRLRAEMEQTATTLASQYVKAHEEVLMTARAQYQQAASNENALQRQLENAKRETVESGKKELSYDQIAMEIENKKLILTSLLQKQNESDVSAQVQQRKAATTRLIENPELPKSVYSPNIQRNLLFALMAGLFLGIAAALALEFFDRSIKDPEDVERYLKLPFLGIVPRYSFSEGNGHDGPKMLTKKKSDEVALAKHDQDILTANDPMSYASEAIKTIRTSLLLAFPQAPPRSLLITSSRAGEGKTFIACNLAIALTQLEKRVVLIDADMRNPRLHRVWGLDNSTGLSIYLTSDAPVSAVIRPSPVSRLSLISSGPKTPRPAELLASARFEALMQELEKEYDFVILDSPPVLPVADSVILASKAKSVLIVVYGGNTPREVVQMAKKKLSVSNPVIVGTVVNGIDFSDPYYYYRYYSSYSYKYEAPKDAS